MVGARLLRGMITIPLRVVKFTKYASIKMTKGGNNDEKV